MRILLCTSLKVVSHYGLSVVHIGNEFPKKLDAGGWVGGWCELYPFFLDFWNFFNLAQPLT